MLRRVKTTFADWARGPGIEEVEVACQNRVKPGVFYVEKNDMNQSNLKMGHLGITRDNPDFFAARVLNHVLSGSFASRLFANVRSKKGLAYAVTGAFDVIVYADVLDMSALGALINVIHSIDGVNRTQTAVAIPPRINK